MDRNDSPRKDEPPKGDAVPHGYTLADAELEHVREKRASGDVLDPIALNDPTGVSVERVVLRVGISVVVILVVGILLAQVACKNMRLSTIPNLGEGVTQERVQTALSNGILWGGEIVDFPSGAQVSLIDANTGVLQVTMVDDSTRSLEQLSSSAQTRAMVLAMSAFQDPAIKNVSIDVRGHVSAEDGTFTGKSSDPVQSVLQITWTRDPQDPTSFSSTMSGLDLEEASASSAANALSGAAE